MLKEGNLKIGDKKVPEGGALKRIPVEETQNYKGIPKVGYSVSFCVTDIIAGRANESDVIKIITPVQDKGDFETTIEKYKTTYWKEHPEQAEQIARRLISQGKVVSGSRDTEIGGGNWAIEEKEK